MKYVPLTFAAMALFLLMVLPQQTVQGAAAKPEAPLAVTSTPTPIATAVPTNAPTAVPAPELGCLRINFEVSGDEAVAGTYEVKEVNGRPLASWTAQTGWQDSGWIRNLDVSFDAVYVQVFYQAGGGAAPVEMTIVNPAPGTPYGWAARGMCHAIEVAWP